MRITEKLITYLHSAFDKSPKSFVAFRVRHVSDSFNYVIKDSILECFLGTTSLFMVNINDYTLKSLSEFLGRQTGFSVVYSASDDELVQSAGILIEGSGAQINSNGDCFYAYTSLLWAYMDSVGSALVDAKNAIYEMLDQMSIRTADSNWLDEWGSNFGIPRLSDATLVTAAVKNNIFKSSDILNLNGWASGTGAGGFFTVTFSNEINQPDGTSAPVAKFVAALTTAVLFLRQPGINGVAGVHTTSIYIYVPTQAGVSNWGFLVDWADLEQSNTVTSTIFDKWVRVSVSTTLAATRSFLDFNIQRNGTTPTTGFTFYAAMPQDELGLVATSYIPSVRTFVNRATEIKNFLLYSEQFDNAVWTKGNCTVTPNSVTAPDGTVTADTVVRGTATSHHILQTYATPAPANRTFTFSVWVASGTLTGNINIYIMDGAGVVAGTLKSIVANGNWNRYEVTGTFPAAPSVNIQVVIDPVNDVGIAGDTFFVWGAQLEEVAVAGAYVSTTSASLSRPTAETVYDKNGDVVIATPNTKRFSYTPSNLSLLPYEVVEAGATNLLTSSEFYGLGEVASYVFNHVSSGIYYDGTLSPDGVSQAARLEEIATTDFHYISKQAAISESKIYTFSAYLKMGSVRYMWLQMQTRASIYALATFDLLNGVVTFISGCKAVIQPIADGWFRCSIIVDSSTGATYKPSFYVGLGSSSGVNATYLGAKGMFAYIWGLQLEEGTFATSYIPSKAAFAGSAAIKSYVNSLGLIAYAPINQARYTYTPNALTAAPTLLCESNNTNLALYSEQFDNAAWAKSATTVVANAAISPDGTMTADKVLDTIATANHLIYLNASALTSAAVTWSVFVKAAGITQIQLNSYEATTPSNPVLAIFDLTLKTATSQNASTVIASIQEFPNGWFRCRVTSLTAALVATAFHVYLAKNGSTSYAGDGVSGVYLWGAHLNNTKNLNSYVPTTAAAVTLTADAVYGSETSRSADVVTDTYGARPAIYSEELDADYATRIIIEILRPRGNNKAIEMALLEHFGQVSTVTDLTKWLDSSQRYNGNYNHNAAIYYNATNSPVYGLFQVVIGYSLESGDDPVSFAEKVRAFIERFRDAGTHLDSLNLSTSGLADTYSTSIADAGNISVLDQALYNGAHTYNGTFNHTLGVAVPETLI